MKTIKRMRGLLALFFSLVSFVASSQEAEYIGAVPGEGRSPLLRKFFKVNNVGERVVLRVNSLGYHEAYINGVKVGDAVLTPAVSQLNKRSLMVSYDVKPLLRKGKNEIVLWTGSGWYKPTTFGTTYDGPLVKAALYEVNSTGVEQQLLCTDGSWEGTWSGYADLGTWEAHRFGGERIDARVAPNGYEQLMEGREYLQAQKTPTGHTTLFSPRRGSGGEAWQPVDVVKVEGMEVSEQRCELCRVQEVLTPVSIEAAGEGRWVVDFGRIVNAMLDIRLPQLPSGHVSTAGFSDVRKDDGSFYMVTHNEFVSSGNVKGDRFVDRFNHHVFRYVVLDSLPVAPQKEDIKALRMRTDYRRTGWFESSDDDLNRIHDMVAYTLENLAFDGYMVDCANIERLGYGGDGNASTQTVQTLFDVERLYDNWMMAWRDVMHDDGSLPHTAPSYCQAGGGPYWCSFIVQAPWRTYMNYGNRQVLHDNYAWMKHWLEYVDKYTVDGLLKKWPDQKDRWWYLGDWAAPKGIGVNVQDEESVDLVNNCCMCQVYLQLEQIARILGKPTEAQAFRQRYESLKSIIHDRFFHPENNTYGTGSQIDMAYPMLVGVVPEHLRKVVRDELVALTDSLYNGHLATGLVGIPVLTEWATLNHESDWIYGMLKKHGYPGYLYMLDNGGSGTWEHWNGERSLLHNCFNGIGSWFYQALGGIIAEEPGYTRVRIDPQMPKGLEWVRVTQDTKQGRIVVHRRGNRLHVELPDGMTATIQGRVFTGGTHDLTLADTSRADKIVAELNNPHSDYVLVAAHRGDWRNHPENSLSAVESAINMGVDIVEVDLKRTKDGVLVVCHDPTIDRTTTGRGYISDLTYEELQQYDLKTGHDIAIPGEKIPTLRQVLELCKDRVMVNLDQGYAFYDQALAIAQELGVAHQLIIKSGLPKAEVNPQLLSSTLSAHRSPQMIYMPVVNVSAGSDLTVLNGFATSVNPPKAFELCFGKLDDAVRQAAKTVLSAGSRLWVNTLWASLCGGYEDDRAYNSVDPDEVYGPILNLGTSIIQTDRPEFLIRYLESKGRRDL